ncbi:hypothetical protein E2C01_000375 [Portunus trituberculatus]|uniref:Uncharacterized protein n=1 Tax=Portunus trituberculatus TaxID=210409 RepID=A0A5B7CEZ1_PORTR|nr:hypothetical protein [Portunus trituberculatus]
MYDVLQQVTGEAGVPEGSLRCQMLLLLSPRARNLEHSMDSNMVNTARHGTARHGTDGQGRNFGQHISLSWYRKHLAYKYEPMYSHSHVQNITVHDLTSGNNRSIIFLCTHTKRNTVDRGTIFPRSLNTDQRY